MKGGVGIDISNGMVTLAVSRGATLDVFAARPIVPNEDERPKDAVARILRELFQTHAPASYPVAASLEARECILRELVVPFTNDDKIRRTIRFEAENYLHACAIEDVIIDFLKVDSLDGKSGILLTAARKDIVRERLALYQSGGVDPEAIELDVVAFFNAFKASGQFKKDGTVLAVDIGTDTVRMLLVVNGTLRKVRAFRVRAGDVVLAGRQLPAPEQSFGTVSDKAVLDELEERFAEIDRELAQANAALQNESDVPIAVLSTEDFTSLRDLEERPAEAGAGAAAGQAASPALFDRILAEAQRTFASTLYGHGLDAVFLAGPGSRLPGACEFFKTSFETETELLGFEEALEGMEDRDAAAQAQMHGAVALGLALRAGGSTSLGLDFRKDEFRYEKRFAKLKLPLLAAGAFLFTSLLLNCLYLRRDTERYEHTYANAYQGAAAIVKTTFNMGKDDRTPVRLKAFVENEVARLEQLFKGGAGIPEYVPFIEIIEDLSLAVKAAGITNLVLMKIEVRTEIPTKKGAGAGSLEFLADDATAANKVLATITEKSKYLDAFKPTSTQHRASGRVSCRLDLEWKESVISKPPAAVGKGRGSFGPTKLTPRK